MIMYERLLIPPEQSCVFEAALSCMGIISYLRTEGSTLWNSCPVNAEPLLNLAHVTFF